MQTRIKTGITFLLASACTFLLVLMAAQSGFQRGGSEIERWLWLGASCLIVCTVHLLPGLMHEKASLKTLPVWLVWTGGFLFVIFAHSQFFTLAEMHAGQERIAQVTGTLSHSSGNVTPGLSNVTGRPVTAIAKELSKATGTLSRLPENKREEQRQLITALERELKIAQEVAAQQASEKQAQAEQISKLQDDPVAHRLAALLGVKHDSVMLVASLFMALTLELIAVVLWKLALNQPEGNAKPEISTVSNVTDIHHTETVAPSNDTVSQQQTIAVTPTVTPASNEACFIQENTPQLPLSVTAAFSTEHTKKQTTEPSPLPEAAEPSQPTVEVCSTPIKTTGTHDPILPQLLEAVKRGELKPTVSGIRNFARVGTERARVLREAIITEITMITPMHTY